MPEVTEIEGLNALAHLITDTRPVVALTGAGVSTDSGVPDYRGPNGLWTKNPELVRTATLAVYLADETVRRSVWQRRATSSLGQFRDLEPNECHRVIARLQSEGFISSIVTQNVDQLHQKAGSPDGTVIELHGNVSFYRCASCEMTYPAVVVIDRVRSGDPDPRCEATSIVSDPLPCGGILKSGTVSFGERLDPSVVSQAEEAVRSAGAIIVLGSSLTVFPAARLVPKAVDAGARLAIVNLGATRYDALAEVRVDAALGSVLTELRSELLLNRY